MTSFSLTRSPDFLIVDLSAGEIFERRQDALQIEVHMFVGILS